MMRDCNMDVLPTEENVSPKSTFYEESLKQAQDELRELRSMTDAQRFDWGENQRTKMLAERLAWKERAETENARYRGMIALVTAWTPPSTDHDGLKTFMLEQLNTSLNNDYYSEAITAVENSNGRSLAAERIADLTERIVDYKEQFEKEKLRNASRVKWIRELRQSLPSALRAEGGAG